MKYLLPFLDSTPIDPPHLFSATITNMSDELEEVYYIYNNHSGVATYPGHHAGMIRL